MKAVSIKNKQIARERGESARWELIFFAVFAEKFFAIFVKADKDHD
jgi:hypothetical protein